MQLIEIIAKRKAERLEASRQKQAITKMEMPDGVVKRCNKCKATVIVDEVKSNNYICPKCNGYFRMHARRRVNMIADTDSFEEMFTGIKVSNPLGYKGYEEKIQGLKENTQLDEAVITGKCKIDGNDVMLAVMDGRFLMASMGYVVGEKITRTVEYATEHKLPIIIFTCSGGARMQEGITSLMQMAKTSAALKRHSDAGCLYVTVLTEPTTGGVTASFAMLGDIILAEPKALIGFAGPRVIEQTIGQKLPKGFQKSEFLLEHGFVDEIVERENLKAELSKILSAHNKAFVKIEHLVKSDVNNMHLENVSDENETLLSAWDRVLLSRKNNRPVGEDYIEMLFEDFIQFHGDRYFKDDKAIIGGITWFKGMPVTVIAQAKGHDTKENIDRNFGMPSPDGYRKALRLMKQAEKFNRPVICIVDTPGAFCGIEAEERGQGEAIARNLFEMSNLKTPVLSIVIGEGGSGGALAMAVADEVWMLENSVYSILSPEGYSTILWKDNKRAKEAAKLMKLTAQDLKKSNIIEQVIKENTKDGEGYTRENMLETCKVISDKLTDFINRYCDITKEELVENRYNRFRNM